MANGYEQFFKKAKANVAPPSERSSSLDSNRRWVVDQPEDRVVKSAQSRNAMIQELRRRVSKRKVRKIRKFPKSILVISVLGCGLAGFGMLNHEKLEKYLSQIEVVAFGQARAEDAPKDAAPAGETGKDKAAPEKSAAASKDKPAEKGKAGEKGETQSAVSANDWKDEDVNHFRKLVDRKKELDSREEELNRQESELQVQRDDLEKKLKSLDQTRKNISTVLQEKVAEDEKKVETLVQVYSNMKPVQAAKVLESMDEDLAVQILGRMKKKNAAEVLNLMKAEKAQNFTEKYAGYRKN